MRFVKFGTTKPSRSSVITNKNSYRNSKGNITNHARKSETPVQFVGVDGEGINVNVVDREGTCTREHRYVLFGMGDKQIANPAGLQWYDIFDFLYANRRGNTAYVGFFLGYDFTQIFKTLPQERAAMLLTSEGRAKRAHRIPGKAPHPVECRSPGGTAWQFDILGNKRLRIRPKQCDCPIVTCTCKQASWVYINDAGAYFQTSFLKAINPEHWATGTEIVTPDEYATIEEGKSRRSSAVLDSAMAQYNVLENRVFARAMSTLDKGLHDIGIHLPPSKWFGPGQAAQAWLKNHNVPTRDEVLKHVPPYFLEAARMSYFGGWFELFLHGHIPGDTHEYDVNSAYPYQIARLPCLLHGTYTHGEGPLPRDIATDPRSLTLVYARVWSPAMPIGRRSHPIGTMLHRNPSGNILRPLATEGWFWWTELKTAERAGLIKSLTAKGRQHISRWVSYSPCDCSPPMQNVQSLYTKRLEVGKKTPLGKTAKLVYNSMYGKFAQSLGSPVFGNPVYASLITSGCRTQILDAIATHPRGIHDVAMVATDGVYFLTPHPSLTTGDELGSWEHEIRTDLTLFKPGVYWDAGTRKRLADGGTATFKARGFKASDFASQLVGIDTQFREWGQLDERQLHQFSRWPSVNFRSSFSMVTALQALRRGSWETAGSVATGVVLEQNSDPYQKRQGLSRDLDSTGRTIYRSWPHYGMTEGEGKPEWIPSTPYTKRFGMEDPFSDEYKEQFGITEDGTVLDELYWILGEH